MSQNSAVPKWGIFNRYFFIVMMVNISISIMLQSYNNTISLNIDAMGMGATLSGAMISVGAVTAFIYRIFGGRLTDRLGRKNLAVLGCLIFALMSLASGFANSIPVLMFIRMLQMIGYAMGSTAVSVMVVDVTPREKLSEGIGYFGLGGSLSQVIAPTIALALFATSWAFKSVMLFSFSLGVVGLIITAVFCNYEKNASFAGNRIDAVAAEKNAEKKILSISGLIWTFIEKKAIPAAVVSFFSTLSNCVIMMFLTLYASRNGIANAGLFFAISAIATVVARLSVSKLSDKYGTLYCVIPGYLMAIVSLLMLIISPSVHIMFYAAGALYGFGQGMAGPALNAAAVKAAPPDRRSAASSTFMLPFDIGFMLGSIVWGIMIDAFSFNVVFTAAAAMNAIALIMAVFFFGGKHKLDSNKRIKQTVE